jgi:hypothetical protein
VIALVAMVLLWCVPLALLRLYTARRNAETDRLIGELERASMPPPDPVVERAFADAATASLDDDDELPLEPINCRSVQVLEGGRAKRPT